MPNLASAKQRALLASSSTFLSGRILHSVCPQVKSAAGLFKVSNKTRQEAIAVQLYNTSKTRCKPDAKINKVQIRQASSPQRLLQLLPRTPQHTDLHMGALHRVCMSSCSILQCFSTCCLSCAGEQLQSNFLLESSKDKACRSTCLASCRMPKASASAWESGHGGCVSSPSTNLGSGSCGREPRVSMACESVLYIPANIRASNCLRRGPHPR